MDAAVRTALYVEDNLADAQVAREAFAEAAPRARLEVVENAVKAFEYLAGRGDYAGRTLPDLIILDLNLPIIGGHQALSVIRSHEQWKHIPVVVFSSSALISDRHLSTSLGAPFVTKPRSWGEYLTVVRGFAAALDRGDRPL